MIVYVHIETLCIPQHKKGSSQNTDNASPWNSRMVRFVLANLGTAAIWTAENHPKGLMFLLVPLLAHHETFIIMEGRSIILEAEQKPWWRAEVSISKCWHWFMELRNGCTVHQGTVKITCNRYIHSISLTTEIKKRNPPRQNLDLQLLWFLTTWRVKCLFIFQKNWWALPNRTTMEIQNDSYMTDNTQS